LSQDQDRISTVERAVKERVNRLFSADDATAGTESPQHQQTSTSAFGAPQSHASGGSGAAAVSGPEPGEATAVAPLPSSAEAPSSSSSSISSSVPAEEVVGRLCELLKVQLTKAHQEVVRRCGEVAGGVHGANLMDLVSATGGSDDLDLNELVASQLAILNFVPFETPPAFPVTPGIGEQCYRKWSVNYSYR
jgi:hypothetical protein